MLYDEDTDPFAEDDKFLEGFLNIHDDFSTRQRERNEIGIENSPFGGVPVFGCVGTFAESSYQACWNDLAGYEKMPELINCCKNTETIDLPRALVNDFSIKSTGAPVPSDEKTRLNGFGIDMVRIHNIEEVDIRKNNGKLTPEFLKMLDEFYTPKGFIHQIKGTSMTIGEGNKSYCTACDATHPRQTTLSHLNETLRLNIPSYDGQLEDTLIGIIEAIYLLFDCAAGYTEGSNPIVCDNLKDQLLQGTIKVKRHYKVFEKGKRKGMSEIQVLTGWEYFQRAMTLRGVLKKERTAPSVREIWVGSIEAMAINMLVERFSENVAPYQDNNSITCGGEKRYKKNESIVLDAIKNGLRGLMVAADLTKFNRTVSTYEMICWVTTVVIKEGMDINLIPILTLPLALWDYKFVELVPINVRCKYGLVRMSHSEILELQAQGIEVVFEDERMQVEFDIVKELKCEVVDKTQPGFRGAHEHKKLQKNFSRLKKSIGTIEPKRLKKECHHVEKKMAGVLQRMKDDVKSRERLDQIMEEQKKLLSSLQGQEMATKSLIESIASDPNSVVERDALLGRVLRGGHVTTAKNRIHLPSCMLMGMYNMTATGSECTYSSGIRDLIKEFLMREETIDAIHQEALQMLQQEGLSMSDEKYLQGLLKLRSEAVRTLESMSSDDSIQAHQAAQILLCWLNYEIYIKLYRLAGRNTSLAKTVVFGLGLCEINSILIDKSGKVPMPAHYYGALFPARLGLSLDINNLLNSTRKVSMEGELPGLSYMYGALGVENIRSSYTLPRVKNSMMPGRGFTAWIIAKDLDIPEKHLPFVLGGEWQVGQWDVLRPETANFVRGSPWAVTAAEMDPQNPYTGTPSVELKRVGHTRTVVKGVQVGGRLADFNCVGASASKGLNVEGLNHTEKIILRSCKDIAERTNEPCVAGALRGIRDELSDDERAFLQRTFQEYLHVDF